MDIYSVIKEKNIILPEPPPIGGVYVTAKQLGNLVYISGHGPIIDGKPAYLGKVGQELTLEEGQEAAKIAIINVLSSLHKFLGDLNKVKGVLKVFGLVACSNDFYSQPQVINAASQLLVDVFGENGKHTRSAVGTNVLPGNIPVEIEAIFEV